MRALLAFACALALQGVALAETVAIVGGRVITAGPKGDLAQGTVLIRDGRIVAVGSDLPVPVEARVIDANGKTVTPGFVSPVAGIGLKDTMEIDDTIPIGMLGAANKIGLAFNPGNGSVRTNLLEGSTSAIIAPAVSAAAVKEGRPFGGRAALVELSGRPDFMIMDDVANVLDLSKNEDVASRGAVIPMVRALLAEARLPSRRPPGATADEIGRAAAVEALRPVASGAQMLLVDVERASDILNALRLAREEKIKIALVGASEGWLVADQIAAAKVPVIIAGDLNLPATFQQLNATYQNARRLAEAGVEIAILPAGSPGSVRNSGPVRYVAGRTVGYGLDYVTAIKAITSTPAKIFGVADQVGSIDVGRRADVVIWDGDPLEVTGFPTMILVEGVSIPLESHQTLLRDRFARQLDGRTAEDVQHAQR